MRQPAAVLAQIDTFLLVLSKIHRHSAVVVPCDDKYIKHAPIATINCVLFGTTSTTHDNMLPAHHCPQFEAKSQCARDNDDGIGDNHPTCN